MAEHMSTKERNAHFREHYACAGREMPKPHGRERHIEGKKSWSKELGRDATHSKD